MPPDRFHYSADNCSIRRALDVVGEKWTLLVLREAFYGVRRYAGFLRALGCPRDVLAARLAKLVDEGVLRQEPYQEPGQRARVEYRLTEKGLDLLPALVALMQWGDRWAADPEGPPVRVVHAGRDGDDCGEEVSVELTCAAGHDHLTAYGTRPIPGPGARLADAG